MQEGVHRMVNALLLCRPNSPWPPFNTHKCAQLNKFSRS